MFRKVLFVALFVLLVTLFRAFSVDAQGPRPGTRAPSALAGTGFTYQGQLKSGGTAYTGTCDFQFSLYDAVSAGTQIGSTQTASSVSVSNGLFTTPIDFGNGVFNGDARWLASAVSCPSGSGSYTALNPRQKLTPAPMAFALPGLYTQQNATSPNLIGGNSANNVTSGVVGATIGGGGTDANPNRVTDDYGTVGGGKSNRAGDDSGLTIVPNATVGGGFVNTASNAYATIGGGFLNTANGYMATIGGGQGNTASGSHATVGGGQGNLASGQVASIGGGYGNNASGLGSVVGGGGVRSCGGGCTLFDGSDASGTASTIGGGFDNNASGNFATIPGGYQNSATMSYTLAAGRRAKANHDGAFVWGDSTDADVASTGNDQFVIRAAGGMRIPGAGVGANTFVFIHQATAPSADVTCINHPLTNNDPNAILIVTQNWNPGGTGGVSNNNPIGVIYGTGSNQWCIFNQSGASMPKNAAFNVLVFKP